MSLLIREVLPGAVYNGFTAVLLTGVVSGCPPAKVLAVSLSTAAHG